MGLPSLSFYPNMCPDGSVRGYLRTNSVGANLNREWATVRGRDQINSVPWSAISPMHPEPTN
jgi:murein tripeptide amidase MpaA